MSSILKDPQYRAQKGRNGFDVSRRRMYTCPVGMLLPVYDDFANPGDKYKLNSQALIRTESIETAAYMRLKYHVDWFFVPMQQLYKFWNEFYNFTDDVNTSFIGDGNNNFALPTFNIFSALRFSGNNYFLGIDDIQVNRLFTVDEFGQPYAYHLRRLYDLFGFGSVDSTKYQSDTGQDPVFNIFPMKYLAYHKIFYSHYNNSNFFKVRHELYNVDKYFGSSLPSELGSEIVSKIHYRPYRRDIFTNIQPAPVFNSGFANSVLPSSLLNYSTININNDSTNSDNNILNSSTIGNSDVDNGDFLQNPDGVIGIGDLRTLFAYDKLMRITAASGNTYADQTLAHFGFKVPQGISEDAYKIGSQVTDININEVVATASTGYESQPGQVAAGGTIGDIAGKGFGATQGMKDINFTAPCHGIIMAIASIEPIPDYASRGCEPFNRCKESFDFYHPEFDNIGLVPMYDAFFEANAAGASTSDVIDGWTYRYFDLKQKFDVVNEGFWNTSKASWVGYKQSLYGVPEGNNFSPTLKPRLESLFFVAPQYTNSIFLQDVATYNYDNEVGLYKPNYLVYDESNGMNFDNPVVSANEIYEQDNFLINLNVKAFKSSIMSVHSLPKFL